MTNFFPENVNEYEHNFSAPNEKSNILHDKDLNLHSSPFNYKSKKRNLFNIYSKPEIKDVNKLNLNTGTPKNYLSPRKNFYSSFSNSNDIKDKKSNEEIISRYETNVINKNTQTKGTTIKEKIVKETKNITLEPGQIIKPKTITKRKLKPHTTIVNNNE